MFGEQFNSMRSSPAGTIFALPPARTSARGTPQLVPNWTKLGTIPPQKGPGPHEPGVRQGACGTQPLSVNLTSARISPANDSRFGYIERHMRATATPGPGSYNPN